MACRVLYAVESRTICLLQIIQQLRDELAALHQEQEERKTAEEKRATGVAKRLD